MKACNLFHYSATVAQSIMVSYMFIVEYPHAQAYLMAFTLWAYMGGTKSCS